MTQLPRTATEGSVAAWNTLDELHFGLKWGTLHCGAAEVPNSGRLLVPPWVKTEDRDMGLDS